jgi:dipeptidyl aminopeptidase/acylaminoacyl peptidase
MKYIITFYVVSFCVQLVFAQYSPLNKPIIDSAAINHWPSLGGARAISNDGKYLMYSVDNQPVGSNTLIIRSTEGIWQKEFVSISTGVFSGDNKEFIFQNADTLFFLTLRKNELRRITGVVSYSQSANSKGRWLVYQLNDENMELVLHDFNTNQEKHFDHVTGYVFDDAMAKVLMTTSNGLEVAGLKDGKTSIIWPESDHLGVTIVSYQFDHSGTHVCFLTSEQKDGQEKARLWCWRDGMKQAVERAMEGTEGVDVGLSVCKSYGTSFSEDGQTIFFGLSINQKSPKPSADAVSVDVWSWQDSTILSAQMADHSKQMFAAATDAESGRVIRLMYDNENIAARQSKGNYIVITKNNNPGDRYWLDKPDSIWLVSTKDGARTFLALKGEFDYLNRFYFSPDGRYLVFYDPGQQGNFFSVDLNNKKVIKISSGIPDGWLSMNNGFDYLEGRLPDTAISLPAGLSVTGWAPSDTSLFVYDNFDIWKLSLIGNVPINITGGYGRHYHIRFRIADNQDGAEVSYKKNDSLLLVAFSAETKYNGFYKLALLGTSGPAKLSMGPWTLFHGEGMASSNEFDNAGMPPMKAANVNTWLVMRTTATESPNYFLTHDFRTYKALTDLQPQKKYNWLTSELVTWNQPDGIATQGVLYKPENFDPHKKYPVLINYYEQLSYRVYEFPQPEYTGSAHINIPWFVSHGYLVFTPDIYYHKYSLTQSACTTVESAGRMLSKLSYVDSTQIGIAGHSWGGTETNYIVTHTHLFAAALSGAAGSGGVDLISAGLGISLWGDMGKNELVRFEREDVGATLWQRPDLWINHSPIYQTDQITTPLLLFYNKKDIDWLRAQEFFIALRRLEKPAWMLQYDNGGHSVDGKDAEDFTIRVTQFFDHYLKGVPEPVWMSKGIRAADKGIKSGLELDLRPGATP